VSKKRPKDLPRDRTKRTDPIDVDHRQVGRLAMRHEGNFWNAYYAMPNTMERAIYLGSLHMHFASQDKHRTTFMSLMRECVGDLIESKFGHRPVWGGEIGAPEQERSGTA
jgi:hypothetical protein